MDYTHIRTRISLGINGQRSLSVNSSNRRQSHDSYDEPTCAFHEDTEYVEACGADQHDEDEFYSSQYPDPGAKVLCEKQEVFPKPHIDLCPQQLTYDKNIATKNYHYSCWRSDVNDKIFLGGEGVITVLREDGNQTVYKLWKADTRVISGLPVTSEKQLISDRNWNDNIYTVNINEDQADDTPLQAVNKLGISGRPICVFNFDKVSYGVLCLGGTVEFLSLKDILLHRYPESSNMAILGLKTSYNDTACATPDGNICVGQTKCNTIFMYKVNGELLKKYSAEEEMRVIGDAWWSLFSGVDRIIVQCCEDGIVVVNEQGVICTLKNGKLTRLNLLNTCDSRQLRFIRHCVTTEGKMWCIKGIGQSQVQVYNTTASSVVETSSLAGSNLAGSNPDIHKKPAMEQGFVRQTTDMCPGELKYNQTITTQSKHICCWGSENDNTIFLGGQNVITALREDGREQTYNIQIDNTLKGLNCIISGVAVTSDKHLICAEITHPASRAAGKRCLYRFDIADNLPDGSHVQPVRTYDIDNPVYLFRLYNLRYGVLCNREQGVTLLTWNNALLLDNYDEFYEIQLGIACSKKFSACTTPSGNICISSLGVVQVFDRQFVQVGYQKYQGRLLQTFRNVKIEDDPFPRSLIGSFNSALFVQNCKNGILVTNADGDVLTLIDGKWQIITDKQTLRLGQICHCIYSGGRMWVIDGNNERNVRVYNI